MQATTQLPPLPLPAGIRARYLAGVNGLDMHYLEAGNEPSAQARPRPTVLLLHGFPELAYSWRRVMPALADAGYHVIAPDQRGYGRTTGWDGHYEAALQASHLLSLARDALALLRALGIARVHAVVGHDFGSLVAAWCALVRPDVFAALVLMSAPFGGPPVLPTLKADARDSRDADQPAQTPRSAAPNLDQQLAALTPPRLHYQRYYATRQADANMRLCPQGIHAFLRAYYHVKSADWPHNAPHPLAAMTGAELAQLPRYYVMDLGQGMAETVAPDMPSAAQIAACAWLPDAELAVVAEEFARTGFQGALQWYRSTGDADHQAQLGLFSGRRVEVPACYIAGQQDWGIHQKPGAFEAMQTGRVCADWRGSHLLPGAGHWVQQEQAAAVGQLLLAFLASLAISRACAISPA